MVAASHLYVASHLIIILYETFLYVNWWLQTWRLCKTLRLYEANLRQVEFIVLASLTMYIEVFEGK
jgi:hypothetical protein